MDGTPARQDSSLSTRIASLARSIISWMVATVLVCICMTAVYFFQRADEELRRHVEHTLAQACTSFDVSVGSAHFVKGEGIRLRKLSIVQPTTPQQPNRTEVLFCDEVLLFCAPTMEQLLDRKVDIDRVRLRGLWLQPTRYANGKWNLENLISAQNPDSKKIPTIVIEDAQVELVDRVPVQPKVITFGNIHATITPPELAKDRDGKMSVYSKFANDYLRSAEVWAKIDPITLAWQVQGRFLDVRCGTDLWQLLPTGTKLGELPLSGFQARANISMSAAGGPAGTSPLFQVHGELFDGRFDAPRFLSSPITEISTPKFTIARTGQTQGWTIEGLQGQYGASQLQFNASSPELYGIDELDIRGSASNLEITHELVAILPEKLQNLWLKYKPLGLIDANVHAIRSGGKWRIPESNAKCHNVSLECAYFPYPVVRTRGDVHFRQDEKLTAELWASADHVSNRTPIQITADINRPGRFFSGTIDVKSHDWLPLDSRFTNALTPGTRQILSDMEARGEITFTARLWRDATTDGVLKKDIYLDLRNGGLRYKTFPYPVQNVRGRIHAQEDVWTFTDFVGFNDSCVVKATGNWFPGVAISSDGVPAGELRLDFVATDIPCDEELRTALPAGPQQIWQSLRPTGHIDHARIALVHRGGTEAPELDVVVTQMKKENDPHRRALEIQPTWFPLKMNRVTGVVDYQSDGTFQLRNLFAEHGSEQRSVTLQSSGGGIFRADGSWEVRLARVLADSMETTPELTAALPTELSAAMRNLDFHGKLSVDGSMRFAGNSRTGSFVNSSWSSLVNVDNARLNVGGHDITNVYGEIRVDGQSTSAGVVSNGDANLHSLVCHGVQITRLSTPWSMDKSRLLVGAGAAMGTQASSHLTARLFDGVAEADGVIGFAENYPFQFDILLTNFDTAAIARDTNMPSSVTGRGEARLQLSGNSAGTHTLNGRGSVRLRDANLAKLPAIISLINTMRVRNAAPDVFSSSDIDLTIEGPYVNLDRFDLHGESLSMKGRGWISLDRRLNLQFYTILGGENRWLPLVRPLVGQASQQLLQITADGTLDNMQWTREVLPGLNDLFPEQARQTMTPRR